MEKSVHTPEYAAFLRKLVEMRKTAGLSQRQLAERLGRERSFVGRIEIGERRLDILEFFWVCTALGHDPEKVYGELVREFKKRS